MTSVLYQVLLVIALNMQQRVTALSSGSESFDLHFPQNSDGYAITDPSAIPDMLSFSFCFWIKLIFPGHVPNTPTATLVSYSTVDYEKAFHLQTKGTSIDIYMDDRSWLFQRIDLKDKKWHHVCIMWHQTNPKLSIYFEGAHRYTFPLYRTEEGLKGGGALVIGARRVKVTGAFVERMNGRISNLKIWNRILTADDVQKVYSSCDLTRGNVFNWCENLIAPMLRNGVNIVSPSTACSATLYADASFTRQESFKLIGHTINQETVRDEFTCALYCLRSCSCQSFNLLKQSDNQYICEVNNATHKQHQGDLIFTHDNDVTYHTMLYD